MKKRILSMLLVAMMLTQFAACSETTSEEGTVSNTDSTPAAAEETEAETTEEDILAAMMAEVPKEDYGGYEFIMLNNESNFAYTLMTAEELTGEGINDAIYNRNVAVAEALNIALRKTW